MEVTNIQDKPEQEHPAWRVAKWVLAWLLVFVVVGAFGGLFASGPKDIPAGMSWINVADASSSTFYILRGGPRLMLESDPQSQKLMLALFTGFTMVFVFIFSQGMQGKLQNKRKETLPPWQQGLGMLVAAAAIVFMLWYGVGNLLKKETLDFDPAQDQVQLNGEYIGSFKQVTGFHSYITRGSKGSINYHLVLDVAGGPERQIGGANAHEDVQMLAAYLNAYLTQAREGH